MNKPNIFWLVIDCVRNYKNGQDDREKLDIMYEMEKEYASFENMIVSAPSSIMSMSTALSSIPAYYIAGNYIDFEFDAKMFWSLRDILKIHGYKNYSVINAKAGREKMGDLLDMADKKYWPQKLRHSTPCWKNSEVSQVFINLLDSLPPYPAFYFLWYNARRDPQISDEIKKIINMLKSKGLLDDSIFILTSDHGYPDQSRGFVSDGWDLKKVGLPHDIILTDDNINVPFIFNYPGSKLNKIKKQVSSEDILPSILDVLKIEVPYRKSLPFFGHSFIPLIEGKEVKKFNDRIIRSDARFYMQKERITSLRTNEFKFIISHECKRIELYDLKNDPKEIDDCFDNIKYKKEIDWFIKKFEHNESTAVDFLKCNLRKKINESLLNLENINKTTNECYLINFSQSFICDIVLSLLLELYPGMNIIILTTVPLKNTTEQIKKFTQTILYNENEKHKIKNSKNNINTIRIEIVDDRLSPIFNENYKRFKNFNSQKSYRINGNGNIKKINSRFFNSPKMYYYRGVLNALIEKKQLFLDEPMYLFTELKRLVKIFLRRQ